jgi:purine-cytosine permease-like protein
MKNTVDKMWSTFKMVIVSTVLITILVMLGLVEYLENNFSNIIIFGFTLLFFYTSKKVVDYLFWKLRQPKSLVNETKHVIVNKGEIVKTNVEEVQPKNQSEIEYVKSLISEIKSKGKLSRQDKDTVGLLDVKLKQLTK